MQLGKKRLYRSRDAYIGGVCGGIADYFELDSLVVRILAVVLGFATFGLLVIPYIVMWVSVPLEPAKDAPLDVTAVSAELSNHESVDYLRSPTEDFDERASKPIRGLPLPGRIAVMVGFVVLYLLLSLSLAPLVDDVEWWQFWPLFLCIAGFFLVAVPIRSERKTAWHMAGLMLVTLAIALLPMSLDVVDWRAIIYDFELLWPIMLVALVLYIVGVVRKASPLVMGGTVCFIVFWLAGAFLGVLPGGLESFIISFDGGPSVEIPMNWRLLVY